jgi:hypothetical protein
MNIDPAQEPGTFLYFAYGGNMNREQIESRCTKPEVLAVAKIPDLKLDFFDHGKVWDSGLESAVAAPGHDLWGVVYKLSAYAQDSLDDHQDIRLDGTGAYFHYPAIATDDMGKTYKVLFYKKDNRSEHSKPSREFLDFLVKGAEERGLPAAYIDELRRIDSKPAEYPVPFNGKLNRTILKTPCDCGDLRESKGGPGLGSPKKKSEDSDLI